MPNPDQPKPKNSPNLILAFDFGLKWIGVAVGQTLTSSARPLTTLRATQGKVAEAELTTLVQEWAPDALVVGLPLNMDDSESAMSTRSRRFARYLEKSTKLPIHLVDERLTSYAADTTVFPASRNLNQTTGPGNHAQAACLIAESYLSEYR